MKRDSLADRIRFVILFEFCIILITLPYRMWMTGLSAWILFRLDLTMILVYMGYNYIFHRVYDWIWKR